MHPISTKRTKTSVYGLMGWIGCGRKIPTRLRGTNFCTSSAHFASSFVRQPNGPECTQVVRNAPKRQFGSNRVDLVRSLRKIPMRLVARTFALVRPICTEFRKATKRSRMHQNSTKCTKPSALNPMGWIRCIRCEKFRHDFVA